MTDWAHNKAFALFGYRNYPQLENVAMALREERTKTNMARAKLKDARNRLDTIRETNLEISLSYDIESIDRVLNGTSEQKAVCTCPLPYRAIKPETHEESCPKVSHLTAKSDG